MKRRDGEEGVGKESIVVVMVLIYWHLWRCFGGFSAEILFVSVGFPVKSGRYVALI